MNKVYVVMMNCWEENILLGIFSTPEKAELYIRNEYENYKYDPKNDCWIDHTVKYCDSIDVTEITVDSYE